jgi:hypothetical protein
LREERRALKEELTAHAAADELVTFHPGVVKSDLEIVDDLATSLPRRGSTREC